MNDEEVLDRITVDAAVLGGKPAVRGHRLAVDHVMDMMLAGDSVSDLVSYYPWLELADLRACLAYAGRSVANERLYSFNLNHASNEAADRLDHREPGE